MKHKGSVEITFEERKAIEKLLSENWTIGAIASSIGRSHSGIKLEIRRSGGRDSYNAQKAHECHLAIRRDAVIKNQKGLSDETVRIIKEGISRGDSLTKIRKAANVTRHMLKESIKRFGWESKKRNYVSFIERIEVIESQVEILFDVLKSKGII